MTDREVDHEHVMREIVGHAQATGGVNRSTAYQP
jgi:hypothetical protein